MDAALAAIIASAVSGGLGLWGVRMARRQMRDQLEHQTKENDANRRFQLMNQHYVPRMVDRIDDLHISLFDCWEKLLEYRSQGPVVGRLTAAGFEAARKECVRRLALAKIYMTDADFEAILGTLTRLADAAEALSRLAPDDSIGWDQLRDCYRQARVRIGRLLDPGIGKRFQSPDEAVRGTS